MEQINKNTLESYTLLNDDGNYISCPYWTYADFEIPDANLHSAVAYKFNNDTKNGYYIEIGAGHYKDNNNTYFLESFHDWKGVSIDIQPHLVDAFNNKRKNPCILGDATTFNWSKYLEENNFPKVIEFLSIDIDAINNNYSNLFALLNLPLMQYKFKVISIEHNFGVYYNLKHCRDLQRDILTALGYSLVVAGEIDDIWSLERIGSLNGYDGLFSVLRGKF